MSANAKTGLRRRSKVFPFLIWIKHSPARPPAICGMRHHALILIAWYSWFAVLLGALVYFLVG